MIYFQINKNLSYTGITFLFLGRKDHGSMCSLCSLCFSRKKPIPMVHLKKHLLYPDSHDNNKIIIIWGLGHLGNRPGVSLTWKRASGRSNINNLGSLAPRDKWPKQSQIMLHLVTSHLAGPVLGPWCNILPRPTPRRPNTRIWKSDIYH